MEEGKKKKPYNRQRNNRSVGRSVSRIYAPDKSGKPKETQAMEMQSTQRKRRTLLSL